MKKIAVFYHVFSPIDERKTMIYWWLDEQLSIIKNTGLSNLAETYICITAPVHMEWGKHGSNLINFINTRYPFSKILDVRDTGDTPIYEGQTLERLHQYCQHNDAYVLYMHSKGIVNSTLQTYLWAKALNYYCVEKWQSILKIFQDPSVDIVGLADQLSGSNCISGNFWWAKSEYIKNLPAPLDSSKYQKDPEKFPGRKNYRWTFEDWYQLNTPKICHIHNTGIANHYDTPYYITK